MVGWPFFMSKGHEQLGFPCLDREELSANDGVQHINDLSNAHIECLRHKLLKGQPEVLEHLLPHRVATFSTFPIFARYLLKSST